MVLVLVGNLQFAVGSEGNGYQYLAPTLRFGACQNHISAISRTNSSTTKSNPFFPIHSG